MSSICKTTVFLMFLAPALAGAQNVPIPPDARVAVVSVQRISTESIFGKAAVARVNALQQQRASEIRAKQASLAGLQQQLDRATAPDERARLSAQVATERTELERMNIQAQADLQNLQREISVELRPKLIAVFNELLKGTHIEMVSNSDTTAIWIASGLDLTNTVIERLDATASTGNPATPPAGRGNAPTPATPTPPGTNTPRSTSPATTPRTP